MGIASQLFDDQSRLSRSSSITRTSVIAKVRSCAEYIWIVMMFALFIALGPFAAIAVVPAVFSLAFNQGDNPLPESIEN